MPVSGRAALAGAPETACTVEVTDTAFVLTPEQGAAVSLAYTDIADVEDRDYTIVLTGFDGAVHTLSMLGKAYGQVLADLRERRNEVLRKDLLLRGVGLQDTYPGELVGGDAAGRVEIRLYEDLLVVEPERGVMFGVPYSLIERVDWDAGTYRATLTTDDGGSVTFAKLAKRSEEFVAELRRLIAALEDRTAKTLGLLLPGVDSALVARLASVTRDGRAVRRDVVEAIDAALWPALEAAMAPDEVRRAAYEHLRSLTPPGEAFFGIKATRSAAETPDVAGDAPPSGAPGPAEEPPSGGPGSAKEPPSGDAGDAPAQSDPGRVADLWYFCPLAFDGRRVNAIAQEVTSQSGHATYLFRVTDDERFASLSSEGARAETARAVSALNRSLLLLNFRREPLYASSSEIEGGRFARYRVALRLLPYLRRARESFIGRAAHNQTWAEQVAALAKGGKAATGSR